MRRVRISLSEASSALLRLAADKSKCRGISLLYVKRMKMMTGRFYPCPFAGWLMRRAFYKWIAAERQQERAEGGLRAE